MFSAEFLQVISATIQQPESRGVDQEINSVPNLLDDLVTRTR